MAGYNHMAGMSNNAVAAYNAGIKPLSQIKLEDLREQDITISLSFARWLAKEGHWHSSEWHHSGGTFYNEVNFYNPEDLASAIAEGDIDLTALHEVYQHSKKEKAEEKTYRVEGTYESWGGTRNYPKFLGHIAFTGTLKGDWIHLDEGGKKKASGKNIKWEYLKPEVNRVQEDEYEME